jgi:hypothetical protein
LFALGCVCLFACALDKQTHLFLLLFGLFCM